MSQSEEGQAGQNEETATTGEQTENIASSARQTEGPADGGDGDGAKSKVVAVAAGTGAAVAGIAGGIAVAARDTRRRVLGVPLGKRNRFQRGASAVVDRVQEPARRLGSRFSRD
jgi:hypothetical protein